MQGFALLTPPTVFQAPLSQLYKLKSHINNHSRVGLTHPNTYILTFFSHLTNYYFIKQWNAPKSLCVVVVSVQNKTSFQNKVLSCICYKSVSVMEKEFFLNQSFNNTVMMMNKVSFNITWKTNFTYNFKNYIFFQCILEGCQGVGKGFQPSSLLPYSQSLFLSVCFSCTKHRVKIERRVILFS